MTENTANITTALPETSIRDYISLLKPRVMSLVVFTGFIGMLLAPGEIHPLIGSIAIFCIALGSGAAGAINMWWERDTDALMERTKNRAIPAGRIPADYALDFAMVCAAVSVYLMALTVNVLAAGLLLTAILFYVFVYTIWLKRRTPQNIVIGGAAGAIPPMIGWAATTGSLSIEPVLLFSIIFMWTPPHFWALSLYRCKDYAKAGIPMLPAVKGSRHTRASMLVYMALLIPTSLAPYAIGMSGIIYAGVASILGAKFAWHSLKVWNAKELETEEREAKKMFGFSILYLLGLFMGLIADHLLGGLL